VSIALALCAAVVYGAGDYCGGRAARDASALSVTLSGQATSLVLLAAMLPVLGDPFPACRDLGFGAAGGLCGTGGLICLYYGLSHGSMTVVAPTAGVVSVAVPVVWGLVSGERPGTVALAGLVAAAVAVALIGGVLAGRAQRTPRRIVAITLVAGLGFGFIFVFLDNTSGDSGLWPLLAARSATVPAVATLGIALRAPLAVARPAQPLAAASGVLDMLANVFYLMATRRGLLSIAAAVTGMYPASTIVLATTIDGERMARTQLAGLSIAAAALVMITFGE
jgi:drug/metabolite transporter (DMT)-like permease